MQDDGDIREDGEGAGVPEAGKRGLTGPGNAGAAPEEAGTTPSPTGGKGASRGVRQPPPPRPKTARLLAEEDALANRGSRHQRRSAWVLTALALLLSGAFIFALVYNFSGQADRDGARAGAEQERLASASRSSSTPTRTSLVNISEVKVGVQNGTSKPGLARAAANSLSTQGFRVIEVTNGKPVKGVAVIRFGVPGRTNATEVARRFPGATLEQDARKNDTVTVIVGPSFKAVTDPDAIPSPAA